MPSEEELKAKAEAEAKSKADAEAEAAKKKDLSELTPAQQRQVFAYLINQNETLRREIAAQSQRIEGLAQQPKEPATGKEPPDLETLSRSEFANVIVGEIEKKLLKPLADRLGESEAGNEKLRAEAELKDAIKSNPDFWEFQRETQGILEKHPQLTVNEALILARASAPDKVKMLEEKRAKEAEGKNVIELNKKRERFGGLFPTGGRTAKAQHMTAKDAAESAWESSGAAEHLAALNE